MAAQAETATKAFPFSGGGKGAACRGGGHLRGMERHCEAGEKIGQDQSKPPISTEQKKSSGKPPKVQMSSTSQFGSCYSC